MADLRLVLAAVLLLLGGPAAAVAQAPASPIQVNVIPAPLSVAAPADRTPVSITDGETIFAPAGDAAALGVAHYLSDLALKTRGLALKVAVGDGPPAGVGAIVLQRRRGLAGEAYGLEVQQSQARITAADDAGLFYGAVTLWQLLTPDSRRGPVTLAAVRIEDHPQFVWRGLMIDSARHFQPPAEIERLIDGMALHKLNVLHWHLTDDQGWRLEIRKYPRLTEVGAWRTPAAGSPDAEPSGARYGGFYTQAQVREIVRYAAARHVAIVPEIEMPGHGVSALLAYPQFAAGASPDPASQGKWGISSNVYNLDDATFGFLQDVLTEVMALFPGRYIHVGGDEVAKERWNAAPAAQARLRALGGPEVGALQADFTQRIAIFLEAHGRRLVGWDEILASGDLPTQAVVMSWHGTDGAVTAAGKGHDAVLAPAPWLYFDNQQAAGIADPPGRGFTVRLRDVYGFNPLPASLTPEARAHLLGLQGNLWTEHIRTTRQLEAMTFPRAAAVAEVAWSAPERRDWASFVQRLPAQFGRYAALQIGANTSAVSVSVAADPGANAGQAMVALTSEIGLGDIRYTTDGSVPGPTAAIYDQPFPVTLPGRVRAVATLEGAPLGQVADLSVDAASIRHRTSQQLRLCNAALSLNLEGARSGLGDGPTYLINPQDRCWIYPAADLTGVGGVTVALARLPFNFALDAGHNTTIVRPPRQPGGELEIRQDTCVSDPIALAALPAGRIGESVTLTLALPERVGRHDLCFTYTSAGFDPLLAIDWVQILPPGADANSTAARR
jgi:hexosaminidase